MNLLKDKLRRTTAAVAGSIVGLAGVVALAAPASAHAPSVTGTTPCITGDSWTVDWAIGNDYRLNATVSSVTVTDGRHRHAKDLGIAGDIEAPGTIVSPYSSDSRNAASQVHGTTIVSDRVDEAEITVILKWTDGYTNDGAAIGNGRHNGDPLKYTVRKPAKCESSTTPVTPPSTPAETTPALPVPTPSTSASGPAAFKPIVEMDCTTITIGMDNPANGDNWRLHYKTTKGEERDLAIKPGEKKSEKFSAVPGFKVTVTLAVTVAGKTYSDFSTIDYTKPADCADNGNGGGGLAVTGADAGGIAGGAAFLLAIGAVLFVMARRRKVKFTA